MTTLFGVVFKSLLPCSITWTNCQWFRAKWQESSYLDHFSSRLFSFPSFFFPITYLPLYINFMGSTAKTVAIMSSVLCLLPDICINPSLLPHTNTRPPWLHEKRRSVSVITFTFEVYFNSFMVFFKYFLGKKNFWCSNPVSKFSRFLNNFIFLRDPVSQNTLDFLENYFFF